MMSHLASCFSACEVVVLRWARGTPLMKARERISLIAVDVLYDSVVVVKDCTLPFFFLHDDFDNEVEETSLSSEED